MAKMMIPKIAWLLLACLTLSPATAKAGDPTTLTVGKAEDGRDLELKVGSILVIELPGRGGTGYTWEAVTAGAPYLKLVSQTTRQLTEGLPGGAVMAVWRFQAEQPGATEIKMAYFRSWEGVGQAKDHFHVKIHVK